MRAKLAAGCVILAGFAVPAGAGAAPVPATAPGVAVTATAIAHSAPNGSSRTIERIRSYTYYTGSRTVVPLVGTHVDSRGRTWLHVGLPSRGPHQGWILRTKHTHLTALTYHLVVSIRARRLTVYHDGHVYARYRVVVGKSSTPTPLGQYFIVEHLRMHNGWGNGRWALATSAYSAVLKHFEGGIGQVAVHAKATLRDPLGTAASHGCVRVADNIASRLARLIPNGTPLTIVR